MIPPHDLVRLGERAAEFRHWADFLADDGSFLRTTEWLAALILELHSRDRGCTVALNGQPVHSGYAVALRRPCLITRSLGPTHIERYLGRHGPLLHRNGLVLGTWRDCGSGMDMVLATKVFTDLDAALAFGRRQRQRYVWSLDHRHSIAVAPVGRNVVP